MAKCHKDRKAKEKRRRGYKSALEWKVWRLKESLSDQDDMHKAFVKEHDRLRQDFYLQQEAMDEFLKKRLAIRVANDHIVPLSLAAYIQWQEDEWAFFNSPRTSGYNPNDRPNVLANEIKHMPRTNIGYRELIDKLAARNLNGAANYIDHIARTIGNRLSRAICDKLITDILTLTSRQ